MRTRVGTAAWDAGLDVTYTWRPAGDGLLLTVAVEPDGDWPFPLPRLGLRLALPAALDRVEWFGRGPGEAYSDTRRAARVGRFAATVDELQTPYVRPQENGSRTEVRWATLTDADGAGLRVEGRPHFELTARRWTTEALDAATAHAGARAGRPRLGQPRPRPAGHRHRLVRPGDAPAARPRGRAGDVRAAPAGGQPVALRSVVAATRRTTSAKRSTAGRDRPAARSSTTATESPSSGTKTTPLSRSVRADSG